MTDRSERTERALRESKERFQAMVEATPDWIWETDAGKYPYGTKACLAVVYDSDSASNDPTVHLGMNGAVETLTVGDGLTESGTPSGIDGSDAGAALVLGNRTDNIRDLDGEIRRAAWFDEALAYADVLRLYLTHGME